MYFLRSLLFAALLIVGTAFAQQSSPVAAVPEPPGNETAQPAPYPEALVTIPPGATDTDTLPAVDQRATPGADNEWLEQLLSVSITDIMIALFAAMLTLFTARLWVVTAGLWKSTQRLAEDSRIAAEAAKLSAQAVEQTISTLRDSTERQLRPYVTVKQFLQGPVKDARQTLHGWVFQVVWQNTGVTPTSGFRYWAVLKQFEHALPDDFSFEAPPVNDFAGGELGSNGTVTTGTLFIALNEAAQIQAGARKAYLYGAARYQDLVAKDADRVTKFCVELALIAEPTAAQAMPFTFTYHSTHNSAT